MSESAALAPVRYSQAQRLRARGSLPRASGPCLACYREPPRHRSAARWTYDHCHIHDLMRGELCQSCNSLWMPRVDARLDNAWNCDLWPALVTHWHRCPMCAVEAWRPLYRVDLLATQAAGMARGDAAHSGRELSGDDLTEIGRIAATRVNPQVTRVARYYCVPIAGPGRTQAHITS